jgi:hypothetical protein
MANYSNQLRIDLTDLDKITHKPGGRNRFIQPIDFKYEAAAMRNLNGNAFKIWRYLLRWYGKDYFYFSPAAISRELDMGEQSVTNSRKEMERKGYLTAVPDKPNVYKFSPVLAIDYEKLKNVEDLDMT